MKRCKSKSKISKRTTKRKIDGETDSQVYIKIEGQTCSKSKNNKIHSTVAIKKTGEETNTWHVSKPKIPDYVSKPKRKTNNKQRGKKANTKIRMLKNTKISKGALKTPNGDDDDDDNAFDSDDDVTLSALKTTALAKKKNKKNTWTKT